VPAEYPWLYSQGKITTPRRKNRKIRHKYEILKVNEHERQIYRLIPKNKTCETIPLGKEKTANKIKNVYRM
jgi:hypothetical protein